MRVPDLGSASPTSPVRVGRYDVIGVLGRGGMGTVYEAVDIDHGTPVALKTLHDVEPDGLLRFKREFRQVADLSHPNLVSLYELACDDGLWFFTMECVRGSTFVAALGERASFDSERGSAPPSEEQAAQTMTLAETGGRVVPGVLRISEPQALDPASVTRLRDLFAQLVRAVCALHRAGFLHLDIKPGNIMVEKSGRVVLLDFGVTRALESQRLGRPRAATDRNKIIGTPAWMSPEQHGAGRLSAASDWYAVGLVLYAALTGVHPFQMVPLSALRDAKREHPPLAPHERVDAPRDLSDLTMRLLDPDPRERPAGDELLAFVGAGGVSDEGYARRQVELVGRVAERRSLRAIFDRATAGEGGVVRVAGPSGVGKSALMEDLRAYARSGGISTLRGRCYERESVPYKAFDAMFDDLARELSGREAASAPAMPVWIRELVEVFPVLATVPAVRERLEQLSVLPEAIPAAEVRRRAVDGLRELLGSLAAGSACLVEIDDFQWADEDSVRAVERLIEPPCPAGLMIALSYRSHEARENAAVAKLLDAAVLGGAPEIEVGPLAEIETASLVRKVFGERVPPPQVVTSIAATSGGIPLFVEELAHLTVQRLESGDEQHLDLAAVISRRVAALDQAERELVEVLSVANNPVPVGVAVRAAKISEHGVVRALWTLRQLDFVHGTGAGQADTVELRHDRLRETVVDGLSQAHAENIHLALGRELAEVRNVLTGDRPWLFDAARHLNRAAHRLDADWRLRAAALNLDAGRKARRMIAFDLAFECFDAGARMFAPGPWREHRELRRSLHEGAAEAAYLSSRWEEVEHHVAEVEQHASSPLEQVGVWETQIDALIARKEFERAVDVGLDACAALGIRLPSHPEPADVIAQFEPTLAAVTVLGPVGVMALPDATDEVHRAATRIQARITSAAYFGRPSLLPILGFSMVGASLEHGLAPATAYGLSIFGIVLNVFGRYSDAHAWGQTALALMKRFDDRRLDARTGHVVHDLVCNFTVLLRDTLPNMIGVFETGKALGDVEYASYAGHAWVHNSIYAGEPLEPLLERAIELGDFMRGHEQVNALHVHEPFEQLLRCFTGRTEDPARLDGHGFSEAESLAVASAAGSRSALCLNRVVMGLARFHAGDLEGAHEVFEAARPFLDGMPSVWHTPLFHQYASLCILALPDDRREPMMEYVEQSRAVLDAMAEAGPMNFGHRVALLDAEVARVSGDLDAALSHCARAIERARAHRWVADLATGLVLRARYLHERGVSSAGGTVQAALDEAREVLNAWGAAALAERITGARE